MNKKKYVFLVLALLVVVGGGLTIKKKLADKITPTIKTDLGIPIELINVSKSDTVEDISYTGTVTPEKSSVVSAAIGGQIKNIYVEEGSIVQTGDLIASIDDAQLVSSLNTASKKLETLRTNHHYLINQVGTFYVSNSLVKKLEVLNSNYEYIKDETAKYKKLYEEGAVAKSVYDKMKQEQDVASLQLEELEATVKDTYNKLVHERDMTERQLDEVSASINELNVKMKDTLIKAPIRGVVKKIYYDEGDLAAMGKPFVDIDDNEELLVKVNITESDIRKIKVGDKVILKVGGSSKEIISKISKILPNVNPNTRVGVVEIGPIKGEEGINLVSGNSVDTKIVIDEKKDIITIPKNAIKDLNGEDIVYLYEDGVVRERKISTGITIGENTEVVEGLDVGDQIAIKNLAKLYENAKVYVYKGVDK